MKYKYPSTHHDPASPNKKDATDKVLKSLQHFKGRGIVVTEKMDGEGTTIYSDGTCHARSIDSAHHPSRTVVKKLAGDIGYLIPKGWRVCGENMYAKHSIYYDNLESYFLVFNIWNENNICLSWKDTVAFCNKIGLTTVPVLFTGIWNKHQLNKIEEEIDLGHSEGYVVRVASSFNFKDFRDSTYKWVRQNHVQCDEHWMTQKIVPNKLSLESQNKSQSLNHNFDF